MKKGDRLIVIKNINKPVYKIYMKNGVLDRYEIIGDFNAKIGDRILIVAEKMFKGEQLIGLKHNDSPIVYYSLKPNNKYNEYYADFFKESESKNRALKIKKLNKYRKIEKLKKLFNNS